ncbi:MAG TPA: peptidylprolyl isomerase [Thermoplasmata archaeon]|nr:peptidylprolyl isomerase [Thermoplasmata archaeon]
MGGTLAKGDIAYVDFDLWVSQPDGTWKLHDTTREASAKQENVHDEKKVYAPMPVVVGADRLSKGFDEALLDAPLGEEREVVVPPEKGAGERDPKLVQLHPLRDFLKREIDPHVGLEVNVGGRRGYVTAVTAGRVRVDFNHPHAGRSLKYRYTAVKKAETPEDKVRAILDMDYGLAEQFEVEVAGDVADVRVADLCKTDERWFVAKFRVVGDLRQFAGVRRARFVEEYEDKGLKAEEPGATATMEATMPAAAEEKPAEEKPPAPAEAPAKPPAKPKKAARTREKPKPTAPEEKTPEEL